MYLEMNELDKTPKLNSIIYYLVKSLPNRLNRTKLVKLVFLIDKLAKEKNGKTITGLEYIFLLYGPFADEIVDSVELMDDHEIKETKNRDGSFSYSIANNPRFEPLEFLDNKEKDILFEIIEEYGYKSLREILDYVYGLEEIKDADALKIVLKDDN